MGVLVNFHPKVGQTSATVFDTPVGATLFIKSGTEEVSIFAEREKAESLRLVADVLNDAFAAPEPQKQ